MWGLIIASSVCGLLFGRYFNIYALMPAALVIAGIAYFSTVLNLRSGSKKRPQLGDWGS
jgi:hypothetical protein